MLFKMAIFLGHVETPTKFENFETSCPDLFTLPLWLEDSHLNIQIMTEKYKTESFSSDLLHTTFVYGKFEFYLRYKWGFSFLSRSSLFVWKSSIQLELRRKSFSRS